MNRGVKITGIVLFSLFVLLIFFSRTIYNFNVPMVTAVLPSNGRLSKKETATGQTDWSKTRDVYAPLAGVIEEIFMEDGETMAAGAILAKMSFDTDSVEQQILGLAVDRDKLLLGIEASEAGIVRMKQQIMDMQEEVYTPDEVTDYALQQALDKIVQGWGSIEEARINVEIKRELMDETLKQVEVARKQLENAQKQLENAQKQLENTQALYGVDGVSLQEVESAQSNVETTQDGVETAQRGLETAQGGIVTAQRAIDAAERAGETAQRNQEILERDYQNQQSILAKNEETNAKAVSEKEKNRKKQIDDWLYQISSAERDITSKQYDIQKLDLQKASYEKQLKEFEENAYIYAPEAGTLLSMALQPGQTVNKGQSVATMAVGAFFTVACQISLDNNFVAVGDECKLSNTDHSLIAAVSKITLTDKGKLIEINTDSDEIAPGETFEVSFAKESAQSSVLIPNGAINKDSDGYFVYMIKKRKGILGDEYYADKIMVYIGDSDDQYTILSQGMMFFEPIALLSDKPFTNGDTVKLKNEGEFFAG